MAIIISTAEQDDIRRKSIPSKVFFNHFFAIKYFIDFDSEKFNLKKIKYFNTLKSRTNRLDLREIRKLLWNSWSTEYAYKIGEQINNHDYYKFSLHWNFPQAYYSVYLAMTAFHVTQGIANDQHEKSIKLFGNSVKDGHYPNAISFFSAGLYNNFAYHGLDTFTNFPEKHNGLRTIQSLEEAETQIALFLKTTRAQNAESKRKRLEEAKSKEFYTKAGSFRKKFEASHWNKIYGTIPYTTLLNLLYRLRIKANYHDIETFITADIDFKAFHRTLGDIIYYLNFVHEAYIAKILGVSEYKKIVDDFAGHLFEDTVIHRFNNHVQRLI